MNTNGHITRGDPVRRTRRMLEHEIRDLKQELNMVEDEDEAADLERQIEYAESSLASLNMCFS